MSAPPTSAPSTTAPAARTEASSASALASSQAQTQAQAQAQAQAQTRDSPASKRNGHEDEPFSWLNPHPIFVIILAGPDEQPFGIQKDFLCHRSPYFKEYFADKTQDAVEHVVKLPETPTDVFGLAQNYMFTGKVGTDSESGPRQEPPAYEALVDLWKLGHKLKIDGLCEKTLTAMKDCRRVTKRIPSTPLLIQVWKDTPEGSALRQLLLSWAAEYMRSSVSRAEFAKSLPQEVLSELVVKMSSFEEPAEDEYEREEANETDAPQRDPLPGATPGGSAKKNVHYLDTPSDEETLGSSSKRSRHSTGGIVTPSAGAGAGASNSSSSSSSSLQDQRAASVGGKRQQRAPLPKTQKRRTSGQFLDGRAFSTGQKLDFCADLLTRMLSGPGFWTRLVGPFKEPVVPKEDGVPDYFDKVKKPMDLSTIKGKMDRAEYRDDEEFLSDMRQIFENCFLYWNKGDPMWLAGEKLQKTFEEKYSGMNKWISKMGNDDGD